MHKHILYATQTGSKLAGTNTEKSDTDWNYIYIPELSDLVLGDGIRNKMETTGSKVGKNTKDDVDKSYIPIQCFFKDLFMNKTQAVDLFMSILDYEVYHMLHPNQVGYAHQQFIHNTENPQLVEEFLRMITEFQVKFLTSNIESIVGFAVSQANRYTTRGEKLVELEKLASFFNQFSKSERMTLTVQEALTRFQLPSFNPEFIKKDTFCENKTTNSFGECIKVLDAVIPYKTKVSQAIQTVNAKVSQYGSRVREAMKGSEGAIDWKSLYHAVKSALTSIHFLKKGRYSLPFKDEELHYLMQVKQGQLSVDDVREELELMLSQIALLKQHPHPSLKHYSSELQANFLAWLKENLTKMYVLL